MNVADMMQDKWSLKEDEVTFVLGVHSDWIALRMANELAARGTGIVRVYAVGGPYYDQDDLRDSVEQAIITTPAEMITHSMHDVAADLSGAVFLSAPRLQPNWLSPKQTVAIAQSMLLVSEHLCCPVVFQSPIPGDNGMHPHAQLAKKDAVMLEALMPSFVREFVFVQTLDGEPLIGIFRRGPGDD